MKVPNPPKNIPNPPKSIPAVPISVPNPPTNNDPLYFTRNDMNQIEREWHLPKAIDLEEAVLGALLVDGKAIEVLEPILKPEAFYEIAYKVIYEAILAIYNRDNGGVDLLTVCNELRSMGSLELVGGDLTIVQLSQKVASSAHIEFHARIILEKYMLRQLIEGSSFVINQAYNKRPDVFKLIENLETNILRIFETSVVKGESNSTDDALDELEQKVKAVRSGETPGVYTGIREFDEWGGGLQKRELITFAGRPGMGKLQPLTEPVLTPNGWETMGNIKKGNKVICPVSGKSIIVKDVFPQENLNIYKVSFNDGTYTECCNEHLFKIQTQKDITNKKYRIIDVDWMMNNGIKDSRGKSKFRIQLTNAVEFKNKKVPINPYVLGLLIGNGYMPISNNCVLTNHSDQAKEIYYKIKNILPNNIDVFLNKKSNNVNAQRIVFSKRLNSLLADIGLLGKKSRDKFIPDLYLYNSIEVRKELLAGLMDSDGSCIVFGNKKKANYSTMSLQLKNDIIELIRSLGGKATASSETRKKYKKNGRCWNVWLKTPFNPFKLEYKKQRFDKFKYFQTFTKTITSIDYLRKDKGQCISVDSKEHLYITRGYTVTHNTTAILSIGAKCAFDKEIPIAFFTLEMTKTDLKGRLASRGLKIPYSKIRKGIISDSEMSEIRFYYNYIDESNFHIIDKMTIHEKICSKIRELVLKKGVRIIFIDYVQLIKLARRTSDKAGDLSIITQDLKSLANELNIPIVILAQLNREVDKRPNKRPGLSDLKQSGSIEEDSDTVGFFYRPAYYEDNKGVGLPDEVVGKAQFIIAKGRSTGTRDFWTFFDFVNCDFRSYD